MKYIKTFESFSPMEDEFREEEACKSCGCEECECVPKRREEEEEDRFGEESEEEGGFQNREDMMKFEKKKVLSPKQKKIAAKADPKDKITGDDFKKLREEKKDKKSDKKEDDSKGLSAAQKKLPKGLRDAIAKGVRD